MTAPSVTAPVKSSSLPFLALIAGGVAVGFSPIFVRLSDLSPIASGFYRLALAYPAVLLLARLYPDAPSGPLTAKERGLLIFTGLIFGLDIICWHLALAYTTVADATLISNTAPIMVALGAFLIFGQRMNPMFIMGLALAVAGVFSLAIQKAGSAAPIDRLTGDALAVGAAMSYATYLLLLSKLRRKHGTQRIMLYTTLVSAALLFPLALFTAPTMISGSLAGWGILLAMALVSHVGGQATMTYALAHLPAAYSSMTQLMQAAVAVVAAWAILGESLTLLKFVSAAVILIGILICRRAGSR
ncbi:DMT family transporter [Aestuariivirga sp.]|uniref:DMT family transporter n=1 Tax=Aestuariivirga sp. TaxID=2650926 RepID=UPI0039E69C7A